MFAPAARLDLRVTVQERTPVQHPATGEVTEAWMDLFTLWMGRRDVRPGVERFAAQQVVAEADITFIVRRSDFTLDIRPDAHRLVHRGRVFEIHGIADLGRPAGRLEIACSARAEEDFGS